MKNELTYRYLTIYLIICIYVFKKLGISKYNKESAKSFNCEIIVEQSVLVKVLPEAVVWYTIMLLLKTGSLAYLELTH